MRRIYGFIICLFSIIMAASIISDFNMSDLGIFISLQTLLFFILIFTGVIAGTSGFKTFTMGVNGVLSKKYYMTDEQREKAVALFVLLRRTTLYAAVLQMMAGLMLNELKKVLRYMYQEVKEYLKETQAFYSVIILIRRQVLGNNL